MLSILVIMLKSNNIDCQADVKLTITNNSIIQKSSGNIPIELDLQPYKLYDANIYVQTNINLSLSAKILSDYYKDIPLIYRWSNKDKIIADGMNITTLTYMFEKPYDSNFIRVEVFHENNQHINDTGSSQINLLVKMPVIVQNPIGKLFIQHGELLNINLVLNGSAPFEYCYRICREGSLIPCNFCFLNELTTDNKIPISKYLHYVGNYTLYFEVKNIFGQEYKYYALKVNGTIREQTLPIAPIASSILAVLILMTGVTLHLHFRKTASTEIADFDFIGPGQEEDDWEEELSFIERVKYIFCGQNQEYSRNLIGYHKTTRIYNTFALLI